MRTQMTARGPPGPSPRNTQEIQGSQKPRKSEVREVWHSRGEANLIKCLELETGAAVTFWVCLPWL